MIDPCFTGHLPTDLLHSVTIIFPHMVNLLLAILTYYKVKKNARRVKSIESTLRDKEESLRE